MPAAPRTAPSPAPSLTLSTLALLGLAVAAPAPAHASPIDAVWTVASGRGDAFVECADGADDSCIHADVDVDACEREALGHACRLLRSLDAWCDGDCSIHDPTLDQDHDLVPDSAESNACGRGAVRHAFDAQAGTSATRCRDSRDMGGLPDADRDGLPDFLEPGLCAVEDSNTDLDGSCDGTGMDYRV